MIYQRTNHTPLFSIQSFMVFTIFFLTVVPKFLKLSATIAFFFQLESWKTWSSKTKWKFLIFNFKQGMKYYLFLYNVNIKQL